MKQCGNDGESLARKNETEMKAKHALIRAAFKVQSVSQMSIDIPFLPTHKYFTFPPEKEEKLA